MRAGGARVYLDHNATTPLRPEVREVLLEVLGAVGGNPSSVHRSGREARARLDEARERCAAALGVHEDEVLFTSGGTESNNRALRGVLGAAGPGSGLVTSAVEHASVLGTAEALGAAGHPLARVGVDERGRIDPAAVLEAAMPGTALVSIQAANNEIGSLGPLAEVGAGLAERGEHRPRLHTDAVQALGRVPLDLRGWGVDLASFSAHKLGGPLGVGLLVRQRGLRLRPVTTGGEQELGLRPGTENVPAIVAAVHAVELALAEQVAFAGRLRELEAKLFAALREAVPGVRLLGPDLGGPERLPGTLNVLLPGADGRVLVTRLDLAGLEASAGSACASGSLEPSHVLRAMGLDDEAARAGLRLSLGRDTTWADLRQAVDILRTTHAPIDAKRAWRAGL
ncbi:MAG TPA: cysteine desulfurase family protein [Planctomycetota bacterium]|nr:cysteine desulfurase family protein [Planctomycetota bacterium]